MRALLVVNPQATATSARARDVLISALASDLKIDVAETRRRGHAAELAAQAVLDGLDVVVSLGGDGTVNEVVNGMLRDGPRADLPDLAVVPGGSTNVFARALGMSTSAVEATSEVLDALRGGRRRTVGLGRAGDRYFAFCAGVGLDAEVVRVVERRRRGGRRPTPGLYVRSAIAHYLSGTDRRHPAITVHRPGSQPDGPVFNAIVSNTSPWTYLGRRPVNPSPLASFEGGLDVLAMRRLRLVSTLRTVSQMLSPSVQPPRGRRILALHDAARFSVVADRPLAMQVDGDYVGERERVDFAAVPHALRVVI